MILNWCIQFKLLKVTILSNICIYVCVFCVLILVSLFTSLRQQYIFELYRIKKKVFEFVLIFGLFSWNSINEVLSVLLGYIIL